MSSAFERMQKLAEEKRLREKSEKPHLELVEDKLPIQPILSNDSPSHPILSSKTQKPTAPSKDFQRVPNSITRDAVPNKLFKGTSKNTYDALYLKTRGAINPVRTIRATKRELMKWIGISHVTIFKHIKHLESVGLLKIEQQMGSHNGSLYEVFIPEEAIPIQTNTSPSNDSLSNPMLSNTTQPILDNDSLPNDNLSNKIVSVPYNNVVLDRMGKVTENKDTYEIPKTSFKTNTKNDDEAFTDFIEKIQKASEQITGKKLSRRDADKLSDLADLLILQLQTAARKTGNVSNAAAFLTEVLRRKLMNVQASAASPKTKVDNVGKSEGSYEIKPLDKKGRESALNELRDFAGDPMLEDFKKWYTSEDWEWLNSKLTELSKS